MPKNSKKNLSVSDVYKIAKKVVHREIEDKQSNLQLSDVEVTTVGLITDPSLIGQGSTVSQRTGNKVRAKHLEYNYIFTSKKAASTSGPQYVRMMICRAYGKLTIADMPVLVQETPNYEKYWVYADKLFSVHTVESGDATNPKSCPSKVLSGRIKLNHNMAYDDATTNPEKGATFIYFLSNWASGNNAPVVRGRCMLRYEDA